MKKIFVLAAVFLFFLSIFTHTPFTDPGDCFWISFDGTSDMTPPDVEVVESNPSETVLRIVIHGMCMDEVVVGADTYHVISVPEMTTTHKFGKPRLPAIGELIALSTHADSVEVAYVSTSVPDTFENVNCYPLQFGAIGEYFPDFSFDSKFYDESDAFYPDILADGDSTQYWNVLPTAHVNVFPFRYNPVRDVLVVCDTVYVTLSHPGPEVTDKISRSQNTMYKTLINYKFASSYLPVDTTGYMPYKLFIVADTLFDDTNLGRLIEYEKRKGFRVTKKKVSDAGGFPPYVGPSAIEIKIMINNFYDDPLHLNQFVYVVLVGDYDEVPAKILSLVPSGYMAGTLLSDQWYALMGGRGVIQHQSPNHRYDARHRVG